MMATDIKVEESAMDDIDGMRLLVSQFRASGAWLQALPISAMGLRLDNGSFRIAVGLRLGTQLCGCHQRHYCGEKVDVMGRHGLSCWQSEGRQHRLATMNNIVYRTLTSIHVPERLEPPGLLQSDGK